MERAANNMLKELNLSYVNRREVEACVGAGLDYFIENPYSKMSQGQDGFQWDVKRCEFYI